MAKLVQLVIEMDGGDTWEVAADQRDLAAWEMQPFYGEGRDTVRQRYLAFSASVRADRYGESWPKFNAACLEVRVGDVAAENVDPTNPVPSAGS
jgi:hypothetical protein